MILTVTLNPTVDKSTSVARLKPDSKLRSTTLINEAGGGGINVTKALLKLDVASTALFPAGGSNGELLKQLLRKDRIPFHAIQSKTATRESWTIFENQHEQQFRFTFPGEDADITALQELVDTIRQFAPSIIVASGSLPPGIPANFYGMIVKAAAQIDARCIVDTSGEALQALKDKKAYLIKPNIGELCGLLNVDKLELNEVDDAAEQVIQNGYATVVAVSMGPAGAWIVSQEEKHFVAAPPVKKRTTVGAGDSMVAGISVCIERGLPLLHALQMGVACGTAATMGDGTQLFNVADVERLLAYIQR